jgi:hypothetical protein
MTVGALDKASRLETGENMYPNLQRLARTAAFAVATLGVFSTAHALPTMQDQDHRDQKNDQNQHPDYSSNRYYRMGNKEGLQDHGRNTQRPTHTHSYKTDDDRKAHDYGYQQGWQGQNYRDQHRDPH